jgi:small subunit ribosomal protein S3
MGQKVNANALRLGINKNWKSSWFSNSKEIYTKNLAEDLAIREYVRGAFKQSGLENVFVRRHGDKVEVEVAVARPGVAIGRGGEGIENVKKALSRKFKKAVDVKISEIKKADTSARIIARSIADGIERRQPPKLLMMSYKEKAMASGAKGIRIWVGGRIGGNSQARTIKISEGPVPLQTFRAQIDFAKETAHTLDAGLLGVKVWVYNPEKLDETKRNQ